MPPKFCGPKFRNKKVIGSSSFGTLVPIFSKLLNFSPHILALLESPFRRTTRHPMYVGQSSKTKKLWRVEF